MPLATWLRCQPLTASRGEPLRQSRVCAGSLHYEGAVDGQLCSPLRLDWSCLRLAWSVLLFAWSVLLFAWSVLLLAWSVLLLAWSVLLLAWLRLQPEDLGKQCGVAHALAGGGGAVGPWPAAQSSSCEAVADPAAFSLARHAMARLGRQRPKLSGALGSES